LLYVLQGVRDRETIRSSSEEEADRAVAAVGLKGRSNAPLSSLDKAKACMPRLKKATGEGRKKGEKSMKEMADEVEARLAGDYEEEEEEEEDEDAFSTRRAAAAAASTEEEEDEDEEEGSKEEPGPPLPYLPTHAEDLEAKMTAAEASSSSLDFLSKALSERMLEEKFDNVRAPYREPKRPKPLPYQLDLLSYYAKEALKKRNIPEAVRIYKRCVELDRYDGRAYIGLARIEGRRRNTTAARAIYEEGLKWCGENSFVLQAYGVFEQKNGVRAKLPSLPPSVPPSLPPSVPPFLPPFPPKYRKHRTHRVLSPFLPPSSLFSSPLLSSLPINTGSTQGDGALRCCHQAGPSAFGVLAGQSPITVGIGSETRGPRMLPNRRAEQHGQRGAMARVGSGREAGWKFRRGPETASEGD